MIKEKEVLIKLNLRNIGHYRSLGYTIDNFDMKSIMEIYVKTSDVPVKSHIKINAICEICSSENEITIQKYYVNRDRNGKGYYSCFNCKNFEKEKTCLKKYGVKSYSQTQVFHDTESAKWKGIQKGGDKGRKTMMDRYGVDSYFKTDVMRSRNKKWMSSDEFKEKSKKTLLDKYGVESFSKTLDFKQIVFSKMDMIVEKISQTFQEKYGVTWISHLESVVSKSLETKERNGRIIPKEKMTDFEKYRKEVRNLTNKVKKTLYENWDGYDYYDNEFIKGNVSYGGKHRLYPTIDHKISTFYGFKNNIPASEIADISNLCITKICITSAKRDMIDFEI
jgi:hypothetical protein